MTRPGRPTSEPPRPGRRPGCRPRSSAACRPGCVRPRVRTPHGPGPGLQRRGPKGPSPRRVASWTARRTRSRTGRAAATCSAVTFDAASKRYAVFSPILGRDDRIHPPWVAHASAPCRVRKVARHSSMSHPRRMVGTAAPNRSRTAPSRASLTSVPGGPIRSISSATIANRSTGDGDTGRPATVARATPAAARSSGADRANSPMVSKLEANGVTPLGADRPVGRPPPEDPAVAGGHPDRPAGVGTQGQVDNAGCHRGRRARRRPAGGPVRRGRVDRRREVLVVAAEGVGELVGHRLAHHRRPGRNQRLDDRGRSPRRGPGRGQVRVAGPGHPTGDVDDVLDRQGRAGQRTARLALDQQPGRADERPHRRIVGFSGRDCDKVCH
jgi:hypothetical protein